MRAATLQYLYGHAGMLIALDPVASREWNAGDVNVGQGVCPPPSQVTYKVILTSVKSLYFVHSIAVHLRLSKALVEVVRFRGSAMMEASCSGITGFGLYYRSVSMRSPTIIDFLNLACIVFPSGGMADDVPSTHQKLHVLVKKIVAHRPKC
jgi:hypothetical protein